MTGRSEASTSVSFDARSRLWCIELATSSYAFAAPFEEHGLRHVHWGRKVPVEGLVRAASRGDEVQNGRRVTHADDRTPELGTPEGLSFDEPALAVEFADGTRSLQWRYDDHEQSRVDDAVVLRVRLVDEHYPLAAVLCYRAFDRHDVLERWVELEHLGGTQPVVLHLSRSADWWLPGLGSRTVRYLHGGWGSETQLTETSLVPGKLVLESRRGLTGHHLNPWFAVTSRHGADEGRGEVWSGALAWSGSWKLVLETTPSGRFHVVGGWNEFDAPLRLEPGSRLGLPVFAGCWSADGYGGASRAWHSYQREHVLAREERSGASPSFPARSVRPSRPLRLRPVLYNSWEATEFDVDVDQQRQLASLAARIGAELFVLDDGWFRGRTSDESGLGDWSPDRKKFPDGLGPLAGEVHALGMGFGVWIEPEMVNPDSDLYREHPDWVYRFAHRESSTWRNQLVLNLARDDVSSWLFATLDRLLSEQPVDFVKWDMNRAFSEPGWPSEVGNNPERLWVAHVGALYHLLEQLRGAHPEVEFEACASGGGRADLAMLARTEQVWTSDNTDAWDRLAIQEGFSQVYAPISMMNWVTDSPNPLTGRRLPLAYRFHVAMAGSLGIGGDLATWDDEELAEAAHHVDTYKSIRPTVQLGHQYRLSSRDGDGLSAVQYVSGDGDEVVVIAAWGVRRFGAFAGRLRLVELGDAERFEVVGTGEVRTGADLMGIGVDLPAAIDYGSVMIRLRRLGIERPASR